MIVKKPASFIFTSHARQRAKERNITAELFEQVILKPDSLRKQRRGARGGFVYLFVKKLPRGELHIVAEIHGKVCYFITGYWP